MMGRFKTEFERAWVQSASKVRAYMFCVCGNWADADDLLQDCYLRALRGWGRFNGRASRQAWLFGIAKRTYADWLRRKRREGVVVGSENLDRFSEVVFDKPNTIQIETVWDTIKALKAEQREVIHLRFAAGLSYAEIAQTLGIPIGTVRSRLHRGLRAVREQIEGQENGT